jgi:putative transcriptional regulator
MSKENSKLTDTIDTKIIDGFYAGSLLVSTPDILDPRFNRSVIYLISHNEKGAMGFIINKPIDDIQLSDIIKIENSNKNITFQKKNTVFFGGPVEFKSGFLLHSTEYKIKNTSVKIDDNFCLTNDTKALSDIFEGNGPVSSLFMLGYAGWYPGQLEKEIKEDSWLVVNADPELVFNKSHSEKYNLSLKLLGIENAYFSSDCGRA